MTQAFEIAGMEELLNKGRRSGTVSAEDVLSALPEAEHDRERLSSSVSKLSENGITDVAFIGGYQIDKVLKDYPQFDFCHNADWENNNILASFMHAEAHMNEPFICAYSDILFTPAVVKRLLAKDAS